MVCPLAERCANLACSGSRLAQNSKDARCTLCDLSGGKEAAMTEFYGTLDRFVELAIKEHHVALMREIVAMESSFVSC